MFGQKNKSRPERYRNERTKERLNYSVRYDKIMVIHSSVIKCVCVCLAAIIMNNNKKQPSSSSKKERRPPHIRQDLTFHTSLSLSIAIYLSVFIYVCFARRRVIFRQFKNKTKNKCYEDAMIEIDNVFE